MIQFNLLPDVKLQYIKARRIKRLVSVVAFFISATPVVIAILLLLVVYGAQRKHLSDLNKDIKRDSLKLQQTPDLNKILTIQNQLDSLPSLHAQSPQTSRLFTYIQQVVPANLSISKLDVNLGEHTMSFEGNADALSSVNKFVDTLKFTDYQVDNDDDKNKAFSSVVLANFTRDDKGATYKVTLSYDQTIFDRSKQVKLAVPNIITTRSETEKPADLFKESPATNPPTIPAGQSTTGGRP